MMEYFYRIYGLRVQSQIPFSEAVPETAGEAEVKIVFGRRVCKRGSTDPLRR